MYRITYFVSVLLLCWASPHGSVAQDTPARAVSQVSPADTLHLTLPEAEKLFQERNLPLLAQKTAIEASRAAILQARLFENPVLGLEQNIYNSQNGRYFDAGKSGQNIVTLEQLVYLAGKRNKRVKVEELTTQLSEYEYFDLLRTLRYELRTNFINLHFQQKAFTILKERTQTVQQLVTALDGQYHKGNVPLKEITRLKALLFSLQNQQLSLQSQIQESQANIRLLTSTPATTPILAEMDDMTLEKVSAQHLTYGQLLETAQENRYDLKAAATQVDRQQANLNLQKALAVPDLTIGGVYDRQGSFMRDYTGVTVQVPLPLWNRNQGNIKMAKHDMERSQLLLNQQQQTVENEVMQAYQKATEAQKLYAAFDPNFTADFNRLLEGVTTSFVRRNISLIEFLDYYETYTDSMSQLLELSSHRLQALEEINYTVGKPIINY